MERNTFRGIHRSIGPRDHEPDRSAMTPLPAAQRRDLAGLALVLMKCNQAAARAANDREALQQVCELLVGSGRFRGASIGFNQVGKHNGSRSNHCFVVNADSQLLGALTLSSADPDAFPPELVETVSDWCEGFAEILMAARRRAVHGRRNAWRTGDGEVEDLRRTEAALRRSEAFLAKAQQLSLTGSFSWTTSTGAVVWSDETFRILGHERSGRTPGWSDLLARVHPEDRDRARQTFDQAAREGEDFAAELRLLLPDGTRKHIRIVAQAIGCPLTGEFVGALMDVSATKEMEEALGFRDQVMGIVGHDLRNPLAAVLGLVGLARLDENVAPFTRAKLILIERSARRMNEMIEALLDFTRTRFAGRLPIEPTAADLREVCGSVVDELAAAYPNREIAMEVTGDARGRWDPGRIAQVMSNLLGNALVHGDPRAPVRVRLDGGTHEVTLRVHNQGEAIDPEEIPVLFEPFRRGLCTQPAGRRGLGLGLHIVKLIVEAHAGAIWVRSSETDGTTFDVVLPRGISCP